MAPPTIATIPPQYLYKESFADDTDLQSVVGAYNAAAQTYLDWFNGTGLQLAFYPGLSGALLDWCAQGIYGISRPTVGQLGTPAVGTLNTILLNQYPLNTFVAPPGASTSYGLSDDVFQRVITWNLYRGDGYRFSARWLKRRVMRFFVGTNGLEPVPWNNPNYVVGTENTTPIGVSVSSGALTLTIHQSALETLVPAVTAQLITLFQDLFLSGVLTLPADMTYAVSLA